MSARWKARRLASSTAIAATALAGALLPVSPAHATFGTDYQVYVNLISNDGYGTPLARLEGTVAFDNGNKKYRYSVQLCWQNAYPAPNTTIVVNGTSTTWPSYTGQGTPTSGCQQVLLYSGTVNFGSTVRNVRFDVTGGWFGTNGQYMMRTKQGYTIDNPYN